MDASNWKALDAGIWADAHPEFKRMLRRYPGQAGRVRQERQQLNVDIDLLPIQWPFQSWFQCTKRELLAQTRMVPLPEAVHSQSLRFPWLSMLTDKNRDLA